ncbi:MAG: hypothetical protein DRJ52_04220 [Thermoprotei archaeon]|nr:MAG: hypothetical protein DRJ52_04220 [Thermoprotei archaeon]RLE98421.1 MAG: hypothetical protein DRJ63_07770 [Thermoprotei archaeon]HDI74388.1 hypothetical protein [Thermoprotei archaeon]
MTDLAEITCDKIREKFSRLKSIVKNDEALRILSELEEVLEKSDYIVILGVRELMKESEEELSRTLDRMRKDKDFRRFVEKARQPWRGNVTVARFLQVLWVIAAALAFMMGIYLFFPPYLFFGEVRGGNATAILKKTLEIVSKNPHVLMVIDPLFKVLGFVLMIIAILGLYQAHIIGTSIKRG